MYNSTFITTYNFYDLSLASFNPHSKKFIQENPEFHDEKESELLEMAEMIYKNELISAFDLLEFNDTEINNKIFTLYDWIFDSLDNKMSGISKNILMEIVVKLSEQVMSGDLKTGFILLFSYSYFHLTHMCFCELFNNGDISQENLLALKNIL
jgi:hypothetical protein